MPVQINQCVLVKLNHTASIPSLMRRELKLNLERKAEDGCLREARLVGFGSWGACPRREALNCLACA